MPADTRNAPATPGNRGGLFRAFSRPQPADPALTSAAMTDLLVTMRETLDRQGQRHDELMTYLSQLPKALEQIPENSRMQAEALAAVRQYLENQGATSRQMNAVLEKIGQSTTDQRRIFDAVRQRLDMLTENDQRVTEHFSSFATALTNSTGTTEAASQALKSLAEREQSMERLLEKHQKIHTVLLTAALLLAAAALFAGSAALYGIYFRH